VSGIRAVISDFGGVLTSPLFSAFAHLQEDHGVSLEALGRAMLRATQERGENPLFPLERGEMTEAEFLSILGAALAAEVGRPVPLDDFGEQYFARLEPNNRMIGFLRELKHKRGVRLALLTNNVREWEPRWRAMLPVDELFEVVVDSAFVGMRKPEPGIYRLTLDRLGLEPQACVFVDDLEVNCAAARELGIAAVRFEETEQAIRDLRAALDGRVPDGGSGAAA
jgi:putative hydrolase of the HAD superfamily